MGWQKHFEGELPKINFGWMANSFLFWGGKIFGRDDKLFFRVGWQRILGGGVAKSFTDGVTNNFIGVEWKRDFGVAGEKKFFTAPPPNFFPFPCTSRYLHNLC